MTVSKKVSVLLEDLLNSSDTVDVVFKQVPTFSEHHPKAVLHFWATYAKDRGQSVPRRTLICDYDTTPEGVVVSLLDSKSDGAAASDLQACLEAHGVRYGVAPL